MISTWGESGQPGDMMPLDKSEMYQLRGYKKDSTMAMWRAGADFFSSKYSLAERCQMARDCYEAMVRVQRSGVQI